MRDSKLKQFARQKISDTGFKAFIYGFLVSVIFNQILKAIFNTL